MIDLEKATAEILIVEDEEAHAEAIQEGLRRLGHRCTVAYDLPTAKARISSNSFDIIVTDLVLGNEQNGGLEVLAAAKEHLPGAKVILITAHSSVETCRRALQEGAFDYIEKPLDLDEFRVVVSRAAEMTAQRRTIRELRRKVDELCGFENIVGHSPAILRILDTIRRVGPTDLPVLLLGESGTGKDLLAGAIHNQSRRKNKKLVAINCAGLSETLLEDELFGHVKGAFTGAAADRPGRFEYADGGTLFLDEVGDMPLAMQAKLLRVLENGEVVRVGANDPIRVDVRIISATNADLAERVKDKKFREDLYFRIKGVTIEIPPLRQRREDIPILIDHFIKLTNAAHSTSVKGVTPEARRVLMAYPWPGNVRQLRNVIENMVVLATGDKLTVDDLPDEIHRRPDDITGAQFGQLAGVSIEEAEKELIRNTLRMVGGNREQAANILGIGERTLYRKIKEYGLRD
ncbi:MAG: sigma-54-dependent Fis family transcriptional regulator [Planctomycetes bacterium]|nr:sigma-54-dependent Fis family transcriptional regulator [Planctomycetota bacterium]